MLSIDVTKKCLVAEGWSPIFATQQVLLLSHFFSDLKGRSIDNFIVLQMTAYH